ncbi:fibrinogen-like YCDxxxxGGGW domain-containing protein [Thalassobellus suaedae]|uniref:Fibrinogen-like YCDxxxxGGGW domain-containing protein n=1 Tax=Thalassobellus suaedae TaxID=3074124 RepID=A0ABY9XT95_9FLAO|nr:fibrinogen-like YCDxxxxGGGW domain-containing protein [Flavobacteriaceae bacterium HL-DH14]
MSKIFTRVTCLFIVFISITLYGQSVPQTSQLIGYYPFYENVNDSSGNNYDGTTNGEPTLTTDRFGNVNSAYSLDGIDDYIYFGNAMYANFPDTDGDDYYEDSFSISIWAKSSVNEEEAFIAFGEDIGLYTGMIARIGANISLNSSNWGFSASTSGKKYDGQWHQYVFVYIAGSSRKIYIDGSLIGQLNDAQRRFNFKNYGVSVGKERFNASGTESLANTYTGSVDEVRIWNVALSNTEVTSLYTYENNPANTPIPPVVKTKTINKNGYLSISANDQVNRYGAIGSSTGISINGENILSDLDGLTSETAGISAKQIKQDFSKSLDGIYWISNSNINGGTPFEIYADMTTDGGGWMLLNVGAGNTTASEFSAVTSPDVLGYLPRATVIELAKLSTDVQLRAGSSSTSYANKTTSTSPLAVGALQSTAIDVNGAGTWANGASSTFVVNSGSWLWAYCCPGVAVGY